MRRAIEETARRRTSQELYNAEHGIVPATILKEVNTPLVRMANLDHYGAGRPRLSDEEESSELPLSASTVPPGERGIRAAAKRLEFEEAAAMRDQIKELRELQIYAG